MNSRHVPMLFAPVALGAVLLMGIARMLHHATEPSHTTTATATAYHRPRWGHADGSCRDTRAELLAARCSYVGWDPKGCHVTTATCRDTYTGLDVATDSAAQALQIDHLLPSVEAWRRRPWSPGAFELYFNDPDNLQVTRSRTNDQKGGRMPGQWCPALRGARMMLAERFQRVAARYQIPLTSQDTAGLEAWQRGECAPGAVVLGGTGVGHGR